MIKYVEAIEGLPSEFKLPLMKAFELFKEEIAGTVKRSDFEELKASVHGEISRLDKALVELAEAQKETQKGMTRLDKAMKELAIAQKNTQREIGGLSHTIGYTLENEAYKALPGILKKRYNITVEGRLSRRFIEYPDGKEEEINIIGKGRIDSRKVNIIGEAKSQLSIRGIDDFLKRVRRLDKVISGEKFFIAVTHSARPSVIKHAEAKRVAVFISYEF